MQLEAAERLPVEQREAAREQVRRARRLVLSCLQEVRHSVAALRAPPLDHLSLPRALRTLAAEFSDNTQIPVALRLDVPEGVAITPEAGHALYRAAQEGLTNVQKHAQATRATLSLARDGAEFVLEVADDGVGPAPNGKAQDGFGLVGLRERVELLKGRLEFGRGQPAADVWLCTCPPRRSMQRRLSEAQAAAPVVRVLLVDDQRLIREGLRTLLELHGDIRVVGEAKDGLQAEALIEQLAPQVVLMDLRMPRRDGVEATREIKARWPAVQVLVLTTYDDDDLVFKSIEAGASGYLLKDVGSDALAEAVRAASRGDSPLQPNIARKVLARLRENSASPSALNAAAEVAFTERERDILQLLAAGATNREIALRLALSEGTTKNYISGILAKTALHDRTQLALYALRRGYGR